VPYSHRNLSIHFIGFDGGMNALVEGGGAPGRRRICRVWSRDAECDQGAGGVARVVVQARGDVVASSEAEGLRGRGCAGWP
jgi:hypothetical protein